MDKIKYARIEGTLGLVDFKSLRQAFGKKLSQFSCEFVSESEVLYHINRPQICLQPLVDYCISGKLHLPKSMCISAFVEEMEFWQIPFNSLELCCFHEYSRFVNKQKNLTGFEKMFNEHTLNHTHKGSDDLFRKRIWGVIDRRASSWIAKVKWSQDTLSLT